MNKKYFFYYVLITLNFVLNFCVLNCFAYTNESYSVNPPPHWIENPKAFGMDVIMNSPFVANKKPLQLIFVTVNKTIELSKILPFLKSDFTTNAIRKGWNDYSILTEVKNKLIDKEHYLFYIKTERIVSNQKILSFNGIVNLNQKYLYILFEASADKFKANITSVLNEVKKIRVK